MQSESRDHWHPSWCSPEHCRADTDLGEHRSAPVVVEPTGPMEVRTLLWLSENANEPPAEAATLVVMQREYREVNDELYSLARTYLHAPAAHELGRVLLELTATADRETS